MRKNAVIRGRAIECALGDDIGEAVTACRDMRTQVSALPMTLAGMEEFRPYYLLPRRDHDPLVDDAEKFFYGVLNDTVSRAIADASLSAAEIRDMSVFFGSTSSDIPVYEQYYQKNLEESGRIVVQESSGYGKINGSSGYGKIVDEVARRFQIRGPAYTFMTACTSSANALLYAAAMIRSGRTPRALVIGYDLFSHLGFYGFESLRLIAADGYRPFDRRRNGIIMGEGCGAVILEADGGNSDRFALCGGANLVDAFNVTTHDLEGGAIARVIREALTDAEVDPGMVTAIKAHGTGSENNDRMEGNGMKKVFGDTLPPFTVLKSMIGHTVGASGVCELILFTECLRQGFCPATLGFAEPDEELLISPVMAPLPMTKGLFLLNYFGFGGNCTSLVVANRG